jgi:hypothetical protein
MQQIQSQEQWVLFRLEKFYSNKENLKIVRDILNGDSNLSLRLIDWFVTNYAKKYNTSYISNNDKHIIVYLSYKSHLKAYSKKMFDPFCRSKRIKFQDIETTVGQLNFFEWAITDNIISYLNTNSEKIHQDMENRLTEMKEISKSNGTKKKRHELSNSATKSLTKHDLKVSVKFD